MTKILTTILLISSMISSGQELSTIRVSVPNKTDEVFIVGNQESLGNWQPEKVKMNKTSDYEREISLNLTFPAEFKFTRGNWNSEAIIKKLYGQPNFILSERPNKAKSYKIQGWSDKIDSYSTFNTFLIQSLYSEILNADRKIYIALPENYSKSTNYPVIYITDAQNLNNFEIAQQTIRQQSKFKNFPETIMVGIYQSDRNADFGLNKVTLYNEKFQNFIFNELIPFIDKTYSTSDYKAIIGHSNGSEYNHYLMFADNNPFNAFVNISEEINALFPYMDQSWFHKSKDKYQSFFEHYSGKQIDLFIASGKYDFWHRLKAGKVIDSLYKAYPNTKINFKHKLFSAEHNSLVGQSMFDALQFIFNDFKNFETFETDLKSTKSFKQAKSIFLENSKRYGNYEMSIEDEDIIQTIVFNTKNFELFQQWNVSENVNNQLYSNLILGSILTDIDPEKASQYYEKAIEERDKEISNFLQSIIYNEVQVLNRPKEAITKLDKILEINHVNKLAINYFISKTSIENGIELSKGKKALNYCEMNYVENRYFTKNDLKRLMLK
ncbi:hypothetical protein JM658_05555 [Joostella atrarenae]|uniref:CBM20 domain-containing protein n=1 Tax=Joostella atrarenae TaxID=679257 RepID=A0ABS9J1I4_9FLAO|nr:alpha/beta hydrolase-fold protein [Joostella atrarenae]MCF8714290.1 hypothetical protein [Joostella atrarenae]